MYEHKSACRREETTEEEERKTYVAYQEIVCYCKLGTRLSRLSRRTSHRLWKDVDEILVSLLLDRIGAERMQNSLGDFVHTHFEPPPPFRPDTEIRKHEATLILQVKETRNNASSDVFAFTSSQIVQFFLTVLRDEGCKAEVGMSESR
jgi:hypothetical protein